MSNLCPGTSALVALGKKCQCKNSYLSPLWYTNCVQCILVPTMRHRIQPWDTEILQPITTFLTNALHLCCKSMKATQDTTLRSWDGPTFMDSTPKVPCWSPPSPESTPWHHSSQRQSFHCVSSGSNASFFSTKFQYLKTASANVPSPFQIFSQISTPNAVAASLLKDAERNLFPFCVFCAVWLWLGWKFLFCLTVVSLLLRNSPDKENYWSTQSPHDYDFSPEFPMPQVKNHFRFTTSFFVLFFFWNFADRAHRGEAKHFVSSSMWPTHPWCWRVRFQHTSPVCNLSTLRLR